MPVQGPIHVDRPLTNISIGYRSQGLIAEELFPIVPVMKETDLYYVFDKANSLRTPLTIRANGGEAAEDNLSLSTATYRLEEHALKEIITERDRDNQDPALNLEVSTVEDLTDKILRQREGDAARLLFTNGNWANESSLAAAGAWSANTSVSNPILNADSAASTITLQAAVRPNTCILDYRTYLAAKEHTSLTQRVMYSSADSVTPEIIGRLFGVEKLFIASASENGADEGLAAVMANIWTDSALFLYVERQPGLKKQSGLYCMKKSGGGVEVRRWKDEPRKGEWFEVSHMYDQVVPASDCGYLIVDTVQ